MKKSLEAKSNEVKLLEGKISRATDSSRSPMERNNILLGESTGNTSAEKEQSLEKILKTIDNNKYKVQAGKAIIEEKRAQLANLPNGRGSKVDSLKAEVSTSARALA